MGYIFAASIFDIFHFMPFTDIAQLVLFWLGLNYMREFSPLFHKARPWMLAGICINVLSMFGFTGEHFAISFRNIPLLSLAQGIVWLWFWYTLIRAIQSLEPVYGDLHSGMLFKLYYIWVGLYVASYVIVLVGLLGLNAIVGVAVLFVVANLIVAILRIVYLYRAWQDFNIRREQLNQVSYDSFSEEKK